jgi:hypothetical protein
MLLNPSLPRMPVSVCWEENLFRMRDHFFDSFKKHPQITQIPQSKKLKTLTLLF